MELPLFFRKIYNAFAVTNVGGAKYSPEDDSFTEESDQVSLLKILLQFECIGMILLGGSTLAAVKFGLWPIVCGSLTTFCVPMAIIRALLISVGRDLAIAYLGVGSAFGIAKILVDWPATMVRESILRM
ncbi:MAG: hypothetical protein LBC42_00505 [Puniceicoccales bacterium]|jgi:hypothetical protein|nr:hypothetical protein [Puniceicoccales bacterium]